MFLDIGVGILVAILASLLFGVNISVWFVLGAIILALLPDSDFLYFYPKRKDTKYDHKHRDLIHYPLIYLPAGTIFFFLFFGKAWAFIFFLASFLHFIHDSIGIGWGIKWLYPFSKNNYSFFYLVGKPNLSMYGKWIYVFRPDKLPAIAAKYGDKDWVKNIYYKWHPYAQVEFGVFVLSLAILFFYVR